MTRTRLIGPVVFMLALLSAVSASADGPGSSAAGEGTLETFNYGTSPTSSALGVDHLLLGDPAPKWSKNVRVAWFDPRPGFPCKGECAACNHFNGCVDQCSPVSLGGKVDWDECNNCQNALEQCMRIHDC